MSHICNVYRCVIYLVHITHNYIIHLYIIMSYFFIHGCTLRFFSYLGYCEQSYDKHGSTDIFLIVISFPSVLYLKLGLLDHTVFLYVLYIQQFYVYIYISSFNILVLKHIVFYVTINIVCVYICIYILILISQETSVLSSVWLHQFTLPPTVYKCSLFSIPLPTFICCLLLGF